MAPRRRFVAPARDALDPAVFERPPLDDWHAHRDLLCGPRWPDIDTLETLRHAVEARDGIARPRFVAQTPALLADGEHYETRIAAGCLATRPDNWHDLFNALIWLRWPTIKQALNARQVAEIADIGPKRRSRAQCALTHFDEAGLVVLVRDAGLLALWDAHDWHGLFWRERAAWQDGRIAVSVFGHALLEHALEPHRLVVGKALAVCGDVAVDREVAIAACAVRIAAGDVLGDPQELRPLPLSGIPGWHATNAGEAFYVEAECFRPLRPGRRYPPPLAPSPGLPGGPE